MEIISMSTENEMLTDPTAARIRALMVKKGWSQNETARFLGVPTGTMGNWMQGTKKPSAIVSRLLDVLGVVEVLAPHIYVNLMPSKKGEQ
jgi:DNA-binding transcriptional regulator YiaG